MTSSCSLRRVERGLRLPLLLVLALLVTHCGTIIHGTTQEIGISSTPAQADVFIDGQLVGQTPLVETLERKKRYSISIDVEGYLPYEVVLERKVSAWAFGNIIFGGLIGLVVDAASGGLYRLSPETIDAEMERFSMVPGQPPRLLLALVLEPDPTWEKIGQLEPR